MVSRLKRVRDVLTLSTYRNTWHVSWNYNAKNKLLEVAPPVETVGSCVTTFLILSRSMLFWIKVKDTKKEIKKVDLRLFLYWHIPSFEHDLILLTNTFLINRMTYFTVQEPFFNVYLERHFQWKRGGVWVREQNLHERWLSDGGRDVHKLHCSCLLLSSL